MAELLLELGTEELPATFVRKAYTDLLGLVGAGLREQGIYASDGVAIGTPRRLIISFAEVLPRQEDATKEMRGPALRGAFDAEGNPTKALLGFCKGQGVDPADVRKDDQYVWVTKHIPGKSAQEILSQILPEAIRKLSFEKSMRWGSSRMRFARPIRWLLAAFDGQAVPFEIEGVSAGIESRGHRFYSPEPFVATTYTQLLSELRSRKVEPDPAVRRELIVREAKAIAQGEPDLPEALVEENTFLTEWPTAILGEFKSDFEALPDPVLVTAMAKHERMFPVRDAEGNLTNRFVFVRNSGEDDTVRKGAQWVLNARFNDARFFFEEDKKLSLNGFLDKTSGILFQEKLGTVRLRADRLSALAAEVARATGACEADIEYARLAGLYAKADLSTGLVSELSSLQGVIGGEYCRREGLPEPVCAAVATQYDLSKANGPTAVHLIIADQLDKLAGYLGLGLEPTGSSDPFGLRRAATVLIEAAWAWTGSLPAYDSLFDVALGLYEKQGVELQKDAAHRSLCDVFSSRYSAMMPDVRHDILDAAALKAEVTLPRAIRLHVGVLQELAKDTAFVQTATRPLNIVLSAKKKSMAFGSEDPLRQIVETALDSAEGQTLFGVLVAQESTLRAASQAEDASEIIRLVRNLAAPINLFFDKTMVMADEPETRFARLTLMQATCAQLLVAGDFSKLVIEG